MMNAKTPVHSHRYNDGAGGNSVTTAFFLSQLITHPIEHSEAAEITWQPHSHRHPLTTIALPSEIHSSEPSIILFVPCPGTGQLTLSPTSATIRPLTTIVEEEEITTPPCVVLSPSTTNPFDNFILRLLAGKEYRI